MDDVGTIGSLVQLFCFLGDLCSEKCAVFKETFGEAAIGSVDYAVGETSLEFGETIEVAKAAGLFEVAKSASCLSDGEVDGITVAIEVERVQRLCCLLYTSPSPRDRG